MSKTKIVGRDGDPDGLTILGAWCGIPGSTTKFLSDKLQYYKTFFDAVDGRTLVEGEPIKLPPDVAFCALSQAGHARWTYIARTHPPEPEVVAAHAEFDKLVLRSLAKIADVKDLPHHAKLIASLPMREGGLGLPLFAIIGTLAYQASAGIIDATQHAATTAFYESLRAKLDTQIVNHLKSWEHQYASMWLRKFGALEDEACPVTFGFGGSLRLRLGLHLARADWKCGVHTALVGTS